MCVLHAPCASARFYKPALALAFQTYSTLTWVWTFDTCAFCFFNFLCVLRFERNFWYFNQFGSWTNTGKTLNLNTSSWRVLQPINRRGIFRRRLVLGLLDWPWRIEFAFIEIVLLNRGRLLLHNIEEIIYSKGYRIAHRIKRFSKNSQFFLFFFLPFVQIKIFLRKSTVV